ncbi:MAG: mRNA-binding ribosome synthesis protein nop7 [Phylliscum demangeonii]|nr:MAG: mRNA-binding ribosome synthesis protein nop7 [Phylliscum demangeonii]
MGRIKKKGTSGQAKNFITRTQAVRKLQISLPDFRRLCIFKGIYPREPRSKKKASKSSTPSTTFYYTRDIQYLLHEPLLVKFRAHKALAKKISKALGRGEVSDAARLEKNLKPRLSLDHIVKERYPTFVDALRDLDDALSMLFLFANLPSTKAVPPKKIALCQRLCLEFQHYLIVTHSMRKSFLSIRGIYYQATVQGQDILWLVPYRFVQRVTDDVDFRIMGTFVEFYTVLLGFVNFRLYTTIGLVYPPKFNSSSDDKGGELRALTLEGRALGKEGSNLARETPASVAVSGSDCQAGTVTEAPPQPAANLDDVVRQIAAVELEIEKADAAQPQDDTAAQNDTIDTFDAPISADADILPQLSLSSTETASLFASCTVFLSRETPRQPLEFLLRAFGCNRIGWDVILGDGAYTTNEADPSITHQVVDRPQIAGESEPLAADSAGNGGDHTFASSAPSRLRFPGRSYVQPQWVWDCVNAGKILRADLYAPGAELPPHLSPWVKASRGQYDPTIPLAEQEPEGEADNDEESEVEVEDDTEGVNDHVRSGRGLIKPKASLSEVPASDSEDDGGMDIAPDESSDEASAADDAIDGAPFTIPDAETEWEGIVDDDEADDDDDEHDEHAIHQRELEAEATGAPLSTLSKPPSPSALRQKELALKRKAAADELARQRMMMSQKKRKLLDKMLYSNRQKDDEAATLRRKRRKIEKRKAAAG